MRGFRNLDPSRETGVRFPASVEESNGSDLSAAQSAARQQARLSGAYEDRLGPRRSLPPAKKGAQAPGAPLAIQAPESLTVERFPRRARLARGSELTACWDQGRRLHTPNLDLAWRPNAAGRARAGIVVPRFRFTAPARNRLRRRLREILRRYALPVLPPADIVVRAKPTAYAASFAVLRAELAGVVGRIT